MNFIKNKKIFSNIFINIVSAAILTAVVQLIIFPVMSSELSINEFGILVTIYGFNQLICVFLGNTVNNIRLIYDDKIEEKGVFTSINIIALILSVIISLMLYYLYGTGLTVIEIFILSFFTLLSSFRSYLLVYFRIIINYTYILLTNIIIIIGLFIGMALYKMIPFWGIIFLTGELSGVVFLLTVTPYLKEKPTTNNQFKYLLHETGNLTFSNGISQSMSYLDRFLITPILGAAAMSQYFTIGFFSKIINMFIIPFNNVVLSYLNKINNNNIKKIFYIYNLLWILILIPTYFIMVFTTPYLMNILYPEFLEAGKYLIPIVSLSNILKLLSSIVNPFILKFKPLKYQTIVQVIYGVIYFPLAVLLSLSMGLWGFALATTIASFIKWFLLFIIGIT